MRFTTFLALAGTLLFWAPAALAGEGCGGSGLSVVERIFDSADEDGSGTLSAAEYEAADLASFGVSFTDSDANADGETSKAEYFELYERHHSHGERVSL